MFVDARPYLLRTSQDCRQHAAHVDCKGKRLDTVSLSHTQVDLMLKYLNFGGFVEYRLYFSFRAPDDIERSQKDVTYLQFPIVAAEEGGNLTCVHARGLLETPQIRGTTLPLTRAQLEEELVYFCRTGLDLLGCPVTKELEQTMRQDSLYIENGLQPQSRMTNEEWTKLGEGGIAAILARPSLWIEAVRFDG